MEMAGETSVMQDLVLVNWWRYWEGSNILNERFAISVPTPLLLKHMQAPFLWQKLLHFVLYLPKTVGSSDNRI